MHFLPDVYVTCDVCRGRRYNRETLEVTYKGNPWFNVGKKTFALAIDGRAILLHAIDAVRPIVTEILVVTAPDMSPDIPDDALLVHDDQVEVACRRADSDVWVANFNAPGQVTVRAATRDLDVVTSCVATRV